MDRSDSSTTATTATTATTGSTMSRRRMRKRRQLLEESDHTQLYRVDWAAPERGMPQQGRPLQLVAIPLASQQQPQSRGASPSVILLPPPAELSLRDVSPFPETIWSYTTFLGSSLILWIFYLLLPRGHRKKYFNANRKRYARRTDGDMPPAGYWLPANRSDVGEGTRSMPPPRRPNVIHAPGSATGAMPPLLQSSSTMSSIAHGSPQHRQVGPQATPASSSYNASPDHPALKKIPPNKIIAETMGRLQGRGIRLVAHGVHCDPKRVWIKLDDDTKSVSWQTEFPRRVPNQSGQVSIVLMRGSVHRIALTNVLYIDVGKKTNALQRLEEPTVPDPSCFSLLTQNGSLDLQANSKLERDALVSCFSMILDDVHANEDWRALYEASPDPSLANSSVGNGGGMGNGRPAPASGERYAAGKSGGGSASMQKYPNPSDLLVEV
jgi:hypothetical protein